LGVESGLPGLILLAGMFISLIVAVRSKSFMPADPQFEHGIQIAMIALLVAIMISMFWEDMGGFPPYYVVLTLISTRQSVFSASAVKV
jgi:O-antigen ligase